MVIKKTNKKKEADGPRACVMLSSGKSDLWRYIIKGSLGLPPVRGCSVLTSYVRRLKKYFRPSGNCDTHYKMSDVFSNTSDLPNHETLDLTICLFFIFHPSFYIVGLHLVSLKAIFSSFFFLKSSFFLFVFSSCPLFSPLHIFSFLPPALFFNKIWFFVLILSLNTALKNWCSCLNFSS